MAEADASDTRPISLFYSYAHEDEDLRARLVKHLRFLRRSNLIVEWHDRNIDAGDDWASEIDRNLTTADIVLLLVSASFIASDYCWGEEMTKALGRHDRGEARVVPVILRPCRWLSTPLARLQALPREGRAVTLWPNVDEAFDDVAAGIERVVEEFRRVDAERREAKAEAARQQAEAERIAPEASRKAMKEAAQRRAAEEALRRETEASRNAEEELQRAAAEAKRKAEEAAQRRAAEEMSRRKAKEERQRTEQPAAAREGAKPLIFAPSPLLAVKRPPRPYPGLRPFEMEEWSIFFGRERMIDDVIELLARWRLVVVHGRSGSGKSSLIRAGVLPRLARQHLRHGVPWRSAVMRPSGGPLWNLAAALAELEERDGDLDRVEEIRRAFDRPGARLDAIVRDTLGLGGQRVCLLVDQFEELFRYAREISRDESQLFIELLADLLKDDEGGNNVHAITTLRSEFLGECALYERLAEAVNPTQYLLPRMDRDALLRAIRRPAELYGGSVDEDLARRLIADAGGDQDELPLIQHALMLLWQRAETNPGASPRLTLDASLSQPGSVAALLSGHADRVMAAAAPDAGRQKIVEFLFRALTDINAEGQAIRRPQRFDRLVAVTGSDRDTLRGIIDAFRADGVSFLTPYAPAPIGDTTPIDISHEALIRCWLRIADPVDGWLKREFQDSTV